jgi:hypothetical protein
MKKHKHAGGRPKGGSKAKAAAALALSALVTLMESEPDPRRKARLAAQVLKATAPPHVPRPHGAQPGSQKFERDAAQNRREQDRKDKRDAYQAEQRALQAERAARTNASLPIPIVSAAHAVTPMETPSTAALQQVATDTPVIDEFQMLQSVRAQSVRAQSARAQSTPIPTPPPPPPPPMPPILVPPITLGSIPCTPGEFERLKQVCAEMDAQVDERIRQKAAEETAEEHRREEAAYIEYQKAQKEAQDRYRRTCPSPVPQGMPVADFDCDDSRICRSDAPEHRDGYFVLEEKPSGETRHNLTLGNF